ncbi:hypothetical protein ACOMHN_035314 [Nucella lapillus]
MTEDTVPVFELSQLLNERGMQPKYAKDTEDLPEHTVVRERFASRGEFVFTFVAYVVSPVNIIRFPYLVVKNGGAVFTWLYLAAVVVVGLPVSYLELALGQFSGKSSVRVWDLSPAFREDWTSADNPLHVTEGWASRADHPLHVTEDWTSGDHPLHVTEDWTSGDHPLHVTEGWTTADHPLHVTEGWTSGDHHLHVTEGWASRADHPLHVTEDWTSGDHSLYVTEGWTVVCWLAALYFQLVMAHCILYAASFVGHNYPGVACMPTWNNCFSKYSDLGNWTERRNVTLCMEGRPVTPRCLCYRDIQQGCRPAPLSSTLIYYQDVITVTAVDVLFSVLVALALCLAMGHSAHLAGPDFTIRDILSQDTGFSFAAFITALMRFPLPHLATAVLFILLYTVSIDAMVSLSDAMVSLSDAMVSLSDAMVSLSDPMVSLSDAMFGLVETILTYLQDDFRAIRRNSVKTRVVFGIVSYLANIILTCPGGDALMLVIDETAFSLCIPLLALIEVCVIMWGYGVRQFLADLEYMLAVPLQAYYLWICHYAICIPVALFVGSIVDHFQGMAGNTGVKAGVMAFVLFPVPVWLVFYLARIYRSHRLMTCASACSKLLDPLSEWGPNDGSNIHRSLNSVFADLFDRFKAKPSWDKRVSQDSELPLSCNENDGAKWELDRWFEDLFLEGPETSATSGDKRRSASMSEKGAKNDRRSTQRRHTLL